MTYASKLIEIAPAVIRAEDTPENAAVALLNSGCLARRDGTVTEAEAAEGAQWEGLAGLPVFRLLRSGKRVHLSPGAPILTVDPQAYRAAERELNRDRFPLDDEACLVCGGPTKMAGPEGPVYCPTCDPDLAPTPEETLGTTAGDRTRTCPAAGGGSEMSPADRLDDRLARIEQGLRQASVELHELTPDAEIAKDEAREEGTGDGDALEIAFRQVDGIFDRVTELRQDLDRFRGSRYATVLDKALYGPRTCSHVRPEGA